MPVLVAPSILSADFAKLGDEVAKVDEAGADWIHVDVMDGHFVPNITFGAPIVSAIRSATTKLFDVHLMIAPVDAYLDDFAKAGADRITVHAEAGPHLHRTLQAVRALGCKAGVALNPATPIDHLRDVLDDIDLVCLMGVNPGFGGQSLIPSVFDRIRRTRALLDGRPVRIEIDGGVTAGNARQLVEAGADVLVAGSAAFKGGPSAYAANIAAIRQAAESVEV